MVRLLFRGVRVHGTRNRALTYGRVLFYASEDERHFSPSDDKLQRSWRRVQSSARDMRAINSMDNRSEWRRPGGEGRHSRRNYPVPLVRPWSASISKRIG